MDVLGEWALLSGTDAPSPVDSLFMRDKLTDGHTFSAHNRFLTSGKD